MAYFLNYSGFAGQKIYDRRAASCTYLTYAFGKALLNKLINKVN